MTRSLTTAFVADFKKNGMSDGKVALGKPSHVDVKGDRAYVVVPTEFSFKAKGKPAGERGSMLTNALKKVKAGWKMSAWAWSKGH